MNGRFAGLAASLGAFILAGPDPALAANGWRTGDKVRVYVSGSPYPGTVVEIGSGSMAGYYKIHFDNPSSLDQYAQAKNVVARSGRAAPPAAKGRKPSCVIGLIGGKPACFPVAR